MSWLLQNVNIIIAVGLFVIGWYFGRRNEKKHLDDLFVSEKLLGHVIVSGERFFEPVCNSIKNSHCHECSGVLVVGSVVIAQDRFKFVVAQLLSLLGKNLTVYEILLERGRREALVRMKRQADKAGCNQIFGVRFETSVINMYSLEILAYGTAVDAIPSSQYPNLPPPLV